MPKVPVPRPMPRKFKGKAPRRHFNILVTLASILVPQLREEASVEQPIEHVRSAQRAHDLEALKSRQDDYEPDWENLNIRHRR